MPESQAFEAWWRRRYGRGADRDLARLAFAAGFASREPELDLEHSVAVAAAETVSRLQKEIARLRDDLRQLDQERSTANDELAGEVARLTRERDELRLTSLRRFDDVGELGREVARLKGIEEAAQRFSDEATVELWGPLTRGEAIIALRAALARTRG